MPPACYESRFLAGEIYLLMLQLNNKKLTLMTEENVDKVAPYVATLYIPWFLKTLIIIHGPSNDYKAFKIA